MQKELQWIYAIYPTRSSRICSKKMLKERRKMDPVKLVREVENIKKSPREAEIVKLKTS